MKRFTILSLLLALSLIFAACGPQASPDLNTGETTENTNGAVIGEENDNTTGSVDNGNLNGNTNDVPATGNANSNESPGTGNENTNQNANANENANANANDNSNGNLNDNDSNDGITGIPADDPNEALLPGDPGFSANLFSATLSDFTQLQVLGDNDSVIGRVEDVILNLDQPAIDYIVLNTNGGLRILPFGSMSVVTRGNQTNLSTTLSSADLEIAPQTTQTEMESDLMGSIQTSHDFWSSRTELGAWQGQNRVLASRLIPAGILSTDLQQTFAIDDIVFDPDTGQAQYIILNGESLNLTQDLAIPVPFDVLQFDEQNGNLTLSIDPSLLANAPTINLDALLSAMSQQDWDSALRSFWEGQ